MTNSLAIGLSSFCALHILTGAEICWYHEEAQRRMSELCSMRTTWNVIIFFSQILSEPNSDLCMHEFIPHFRMHCWMLNALFVLCLTDRLWCTHAAFFLVCSLSNRKHIFRGTSKTQTSAPSSCAGASACDAEIAKWSELSTTTR